MAVRVSTIKVDIGAAVGKLSGLKDNAAFGSFIANEAMSGMDPYVPFRDGALSKSATAEPFKVSYNTPYAAHVYDGRRMRIRKEKHPKATSKWDKAYNAAHGRDLAKAAERYVRGFL